LFHFFDSFYFQLGLEDLCAEEDDDDDNDDLGSFSLKAVVSDGLICSMSKALPGTRFANC
jgi:hypothetical protein